MRKKKNKKKKNEGEAEEVCNQPVPVAAPC